MRIISQRILQEFLASPEGRNAPIAVTALNVWFAEVTGATWETVADIKRRYPMANIASLDRITFDIGGHDHCMLVSVDFELGIVRIRWIGTRKAYESLDLTEAKMANELKPIRTEADHEAAMAEIEHLWGSKSGTPDGDRLDILVTLVAAYENRFPMNAPDPVEAIRTRMTKQGLSRRDLEPMIGSAARVSEILSGKRSLTVGMIRRLRNDLGISADILIGGDDS